MKYQRVTEILSKFSNLQYIDKDVLQNAAVRGTKVHGICEDIIRGYDVWNINEEYKPYVDSFIQWWGDGYETFAVEERFYCDDIGITGQVDIIIKDGKDVYVVDLKTSQREYKSWKLQGSAYSYLAKKSGYDINKIKFVRLMKNGKKAKTHEYEEDMDLFRDVLKVYRYFYGG